MGTTQPPRPLPAVPPAHRAAFPQEDAQPGPQPPHAEELLHRWGERWGGGVLEGYQEDPWDGGDSASLAVSGWHLGVPRLCLHGVVGVMPAPCSPACAVTPQSLGDCWGVGGTSWTRGAVG